MNSPGQRLKQGDPEKPRHLRSIILTVPPSMPKPERDIFASRIWTEAIWSGSRWAGTTRTWTGRSRPRRGMATVSAHPRQWTEATCAQVVYLFSECQEHFAGRGYLFRAIRRPGMPQPDGKTDSEADGKRVTFASIDIGGGTTDFVVTDYTLDDGQGANVYITPKQRFRDGFKVAGDDLLLEVVQKLVIPVIETALHEHGVADPAPLLSRLIGSEPIPVRTPPCASSWRCRSDPLGLHILKAYEQYDPVRLRDLRPADRRNAVGRSAAVLQYFATGVRQIVADKPTSDPHGGEGHPRPVLPAPLLPRRPAGDIARPSRRCARSSGCIIAICCC